MTLGGSTPITRIMTVRQTVKPGNPLDGMMWINPAGGASGNNSERYLWNRSASAWELTSATGPDTPLYPAAGAVWRDTSTGTSKQNADGTDAGWSNMGVTDHANLSNVTASQHRSDANVRGLSPAIIPNLGSINPIWDSNNPVVDDPTDYSDSTDAWSSLVTYTVDTQLSPYLRLRADNECGDNNAGWRIVDVTTGDVLNSGSVGGSTREWRNLDAEIVDYRGVRDIDVQVSADASYPWNQYHTYIYRPVEVGDL